MLPESNHIDLKKPLGSLIAARRRLAKISQEQLAEIAQLERAYISRIERGLSMPTVDALFRLCAGINTEPSSIIFELEQLTAKDRAKKKKSDR